jgi:quercetin dioxygenase-like cupin family protein
MTTFARFDETRTYPVWEGITARAVRGDRITMALVDLEPGAIAADHQHDNEQLGFVVQGELTMTIGGETRLLRRGDTYVIPGGVPHGAVAGADGCVVIDVFSPPRDDWEKLERGEPSPSAWSG